MITEEDGRGKKIKCQVNKVAQIPGFSPYLPSLSRSKIFAYWELQQIASLWSVVCKGK